MGERDQSDVLDEEGNPVDPLGEDNPTREVPRDLKMLAPPPRKRANKASKDDLLAYYLAEVRRWPLLDPAVEKELAIRWVEDGDRYAAERLVTANLRLVVKLAFQYHRQWSNVLDLIQEGNVGLVEALRVMLKLAHGASLGTGVATRKRVVRVALHLDDAIVSQLEQNPASGKACSTIGSHLARLGHRNPLR